MNIHTDIKALHTEMRQWRRHLHQFPETAYEEVNTAQYIANLLQSFGLHPERGLAGAQAGGAGADERARLLGVGAALFDHG